MMIPRFFIHYFYTMTSDDLPEVKLGHGQMSSVSDFVHGYRFFNPYKFHAKMIITRFFLYYYYMVTFDDLIKVKQGQRQMGSISGLIDHSMNKNPCKFHDCTLISTEDTLMSFLLKISGMR